MSLWDDLRGILDYGICIGFIPPYSQSRNVRNGILKGLTYSIFAESTPQIAQYRHKNVRNARRRNFYFRVVDLYQKGNKNDSRGFYVDLRGILWARDISV